MNQKGLVWLAYAGALVVLVLYSYKIWINPDYTDFMVYYRAATRFAHHEWGAFYNLQADGNSPFRYPPLTLPFFWPLNIFSFPWARIAWFFLQFSFAILGFHQLARTLRPTTPHADAVVALAALMTLRFWIDSFMIGQITGLMFLGLVYSWVTLEQKKPASAAAWLLVPSLLKLGTFGLGWFLLVNTKGSRARIRLLFTLIWIPLLLMLVTYLFWGRPTFEFLWRGWLEMLRGDSSFFDSSHYGTQSLNSALLRISRSGLFSPQLAASIYRSLALVGSLTIVTFWSLRRAHGVRGQLLFFSLGVLAYLLFMPFTFKYSLPLLAFPLVGILSGNRGRFESFVIALTAITLSIAGLDVIGAPAFFWLQYHSIPLLTMILIALATFRLAWRESTAC